jgi:hypothetical protein
MKTNTVRKTKVKQTRAAKPALRLVKSSAMLAGQIDIAHIEVKGVLEMLREQGDAIDQVYIHARLHPDREELERLLAAVQNARLAALRCAADVAEACLFAESELDGRGQQEAS